MLLQLVLASLLALPLFAAESQLVYVKRATCEKTRRASIQATRQAIPTLQLTFTKPVDSASVTDPAAFSVQHYRYRYHATYGSPVIDNITTPVSSVAVDGSRVAIVLPELVTGKICEVNIRGLRSTAGAELLQPAAYYTLNQLR